MKSLFHRKGMIIGTLAAAIATISNVQANVQTNVQLDVQTQVSQDSVQKALNQVNIPFIKNQGQQHSDVSFYAVTPGGNLFVDQNGGLVYSIQKGKERWAFKESFVSEKALHPVILEKNPLDLTIQNKQGVQNITTVKTLGLGELSKGIRIELQARDKNVEKLFYVKPGANPDQIRVKLEGIETSQIAKDGQLVLKTGLGPVAFTQPLAFQKFGDKTQFVEVAYTLKDNHYGFSVGDYDRSRELIIDPVLAATYLGGGDGYPTYSYDNVTSIVAAGEYVYVAGGTHAPDFPTALGYDMSFDDIRDGFIVRMSADLSTLVNATFIGGTVYDMVRENNGELIVAGQAYSGFPQTGGAYNYPSDYEQTGGFIARFNLDLTQLLASGVVVPASSIQKIALGNGQLYFSGTHNSNNLAITPNAYGTECNCIGQGSFGANTYVGYMGRISADLSTLSALSWLGGATPSDMAVAEDSSVYVTNRTLSGADGGIRQFDADITSVIASHHFRALGNASTSFNTMAVGDGFVMVGGSTKKNNLPTTPGAFDSSCGTDGDCDNTGTDYYIAKADGFLVRYSRDLQTIEALTYFGGGGHDSVNDLLIDESGDVVFNGFAGDKGVPVTSDAEQKSGASYFAKISSDLTSLRYSSLADVAGDMAPAGNDRFYLGGDINSSAQFPATAGAFDTTYNGGATDGYILLYQMAASGSGGGTDPGPEPVPEENSLPVADAGSDQEVVKKTQVTLDGSDSYDSDGSVEQYQWKQLKGKGVTLKNASSAVATFTAPRTRRGRTRTLIFELTVTDDKGGKDSDQVTITVTP